MQKIIYSLLTILLMNPYSSLFGQQTIQTAMSHSELSNSLKEIIHSASIPMIELSMQEGDETFSTESHLGSYSPPAVFCQTVFQAASLSKTLFATIVLRMAQKGLIELDRPLDDYLPFNRVLHEQQGWAKSLTARCLLSHKSGLQNWSKSPSSQEWPKSDLSFLFVPDSAFSYSGEGYYYLQQVVEKICNKSLEQIANEEIFTPLKMHSSSYEWKQQDNPSIDYDKVAACGFNKEGENTGQGRHPRGNSAYTLRTTASDYIKFLNALFGDKLLSAKMKEEMLKPHIRAIRYPGEERECDNYIYWGLGIGIEESPLYGKLFFHWGDNGSFKALFIVIPSLDKKMVYLTNSANGHEIIDSITKQIMKLPSPLKLSPWVTERYSGKLY